MTKLVDQRAADEAGGARDHHVHGRRVYWRLCGALAAALALVGCDHGGRRVEPPSPPPPQSFLQLDAEHQHLVRDYQPVSAALTGYELAFRSWRSGRLTQAEFLRRARGFRTVVARALARVGRDKATGETRRAKLLLVGALRTRQGALRSLPRLDAYRLRWNRSAADARAGLTVLQDIRDRARLIPLPEDSVS